MSLLPFPSSSLYFFFSDMLYITGCWSTVRYSYLMTPTIHLCCNRYTASGVGANCTRENDFQMVSAGHGHYWLHCHNPSFLPLSLSSPTKVQELWLSPSPPTVSFYHPKALNHIIVVMWKSCCSNYGSVLYFNFRTECSCLCKGKKEIQWPLGLYMKLFQNPVG